MAEKDVESSYDALLYNDTIASFSWSDVSVQVKSRTDGSHLALLQSCSAAVEAGEVVALMGPSGSGKTTLLNVLAGRSQTAWKGSVETNGAPVSNTQLRRVSCYVEQNDALIGSLTVRETVNFASRLATPGLSLSARQSSTNSLIKSFGLQLQGDTIIGTPLRKGISGGQQRRVSVASQLVTNPKILFLDEPTSGLDSTASYEVMKYIRQVAKKYHLLVIASIHQPSTSTFNLFDKVLLLARGQTCYYGPVHQIAPHFSSFAPVPDHVNLAEYLLELVNDDFGKQDDDHDDDDDDDDGPRTQTPLANVVNAWRQSPLSAAYIHTARESHNEVVATPDAVPARFDIPLILLHRNFIKSYRDLLAYGTRLVMYVGLAIMMGTVWLRLPYTETSIGSFITALFFSGAFMSFMAVAYVPSIIEDIRSLHKEHANGLYGPLAFVLANTLIGIPWLALITLVFSTITYWLSNFHNTAGSFWLWVLWLMLDLLAAESLVVLLSSLFPEFVIALAAAAFANGLWMSVGGFLVPLTTLNVFWKYVFHYIDYQGYVFQAMMVNQFKHTTYRCDHDVSGIAHCMYSSDLASQGKTPGTAVLDTYQIPSETHKMWEWFGIMLSIILVYRMLDWAVLVVKLKKSGK